VPSSSPSSSSTSTSTTGSSSRVAFRLRHVDERFADDMKGALPDGRRKLVLISVEACETTIKAAQRRAS
jgi:hypothetical protein